MSQNITFNSEGKPVKLGEDGELELEYKKFAEHLKDNNLECRNWRQCMCK